MEQNRWVIDDVAIKPLYMGFPIAMSRTGIPFPAMFASQVPWRLAFCGGWDLDGSIHAGFEFSIGAGAAGLEGRISMGYLWLLLVTLW